MTLCEEIRKSRDAGVVHCGIVAGSFAGPDACAPLFGLDPGGVPFLIDVALARRTILALLQFDMAYDRRIMSEAEARRLLASFEVVSGLSEEGAYLYGNVESPFEREGLLLGSWNPATKATFDAGVLVIAQDRCACLWVEDED